MGSFRSRPPCLRDYIISSPNLVLVNMDLSNHNLLSPSLLHIWSLLLLWFILGVKWLPFLFTSATLMTLLHCKLNDCGLSAGYVNWFHSHLTSTVSHVRYCGVPPLPCAVLSQETVHLPLKSSMAFTAPICTKLILVQWHYPEISYTEFYRKRSRNMESRNCCSFTAVK